MSTSVSSKNKNLVTHSLENNQGIRIQILNLGGIISAIKTPNRNGELEDIALGFENPEQYLSEHPYFGAIIGRFGNRLANGQFILEDCEYQLASNNGFNHLHGGLKGFDKVLWEVESFEEKNATGLKLSYLSKDGEEGYPGNLWVTVIYTLTDDNILKVKYQAKTDKTTILNLTQHSYFNLSGDFSKQILDHNLWLNADRFLPVNTHQIPTGVYQNVADSPFDFRTSKTIGRDIEVENIQLEIGNGYDHCWVVNNEEKTLVKAAEVYHPHSGRVLEVYTDQPGIQLYTGNFLDNSLPSKSGGTYGPQSGFCLETQHFPDAPNQPHFPSTILKPNEFFSSETWFKFSTKKQ